MYPSPYALRALAAGALLSLLVVACGDPAGDAAAESALAAAGAEDVVIGEDGETIKYRTGDGEVTITGGNAATLPGDFPKDVYLPAEFVVESTLAMNRDLFVGLGVEEDVTVLYGAAREAMAGQGWTETLAALENSENGLLTFEKDDRSVVVSFTRESDRTNMGLQLTHLAR